MPCPIAYRLRQFGAAGLFLSSCTAAFAAAPSWIVSLGNASVGSNWSTTSVPGALDLVTIAAGSITFDTNTTYGALDFSGGNLNGSATLTLGTVAGSTWSGGTMTFTGGGGLTVGPGSTLAVAGAATDHDFDGTVLTNAGTVDWTGGRLRSGHGGQIANKGTWIDSASSDVNNDLGGSFSFTNTGSYLKTGAGATTVAVPFINNNGTVNVANGALVFSSTFTHSGGNFVVARGATAQFNNGLNVNTGALVGAGTIIGNVASNGIVATGSTPGTLTINGDLSLLGSSTLVIQVGGTGQGTSYDFLDVTGNATIGGLLDISMLNGVASTILSTDTLTILLSRGLTGAFANVANGQRLFASDGTSSFQVNYGAGVNGIVLSNFEAVPEPSTYALIAVGLAILGLGMRRRCRQQRD